MVKFVVLSLIFLSTLTSYADVGNLKLSQLPVGSKIVLADNLPLSTPGYLAYFLGPNGAMTLGFYPCSGKIEQLMDFSNTTFRTSTLLTAEYAKSEGYYQPIKQEVENFSYQLSNKKICHFKIYYSVKTGFDAENIADRLTVHEFNQIFGSQVRIIPNR